MKRGAGGKGFPDGILLSSVIALWGLGLIMIYSASSVVVADQYGDPYYFFKRQLVWSLVGLVGMAAAARLPAAFWYKGAPLFFLGAILLLLLLLTPLGASSHGATRWLSLGPLRLQPSEPAKLALIIFFARWLHDRGKRLQRFRTGTLPFLLLAGAVAGLIMVEDLGTAAIVLGTALAMLFLAGAPFLHLVGAALAAVPAGYLAIRLEPFRMKRLLAFLDPFQDPLGTGFHIIQGLYAVASGGLFGVGLGGSIAKRYYLPERHTDFIFAVIAEEMGFVGGLLVLVLFGVIAWRGFRVALLAPHPFLSLLAGGITSLILLQAMLNIGVVLSVLPVTGITLPFLSFGGSSLVVSLAGVGILLGISRELRREG
ncbi:MAG: putative lipid II flippase FtsW [Bacillota bacterium]|nr:putative lipid II flippase FtsW [Bacillota bacterium]